MHKRILLILFVLTFLSLLHTQVNSQVQRAPLWQFQAIDTMKMSRDESRETLQNPSSTQKITQQVADIAAVGVTHVAIATPYDEEFLPVLRLWVEAARAQNLNVWFRGNWSGWEKWFGYSGITRQQHIEKTKAFIENHSDLFVGGDVFSACPECENGGPGDPRTTSDTGGFRKFIIDEYQVTKTAFAKINKQVASNYVSMNGDVARLIMDRETTKAMDGIVVIDHYVKTPDQLVADVVALSEKSGGKVVLGEFGVPIPDINGVMTEQQQAQWLKEAVAKLAQTPQLVGLSYWVNVGGSTRIWNDDGTSRAAVSVLAEYFRPRQIAVELKDDLRKFIRMQKVRVNGRETVTDEYGKFLLQILPDEKEIAIRVDNYESKNISLQNDQTTYSLILRKNEKSLWEKFVLFIQSFFRPQQSY